MSIPFTQYLLPDGRQSPVTIVVPPEVEKKARRVIAAGLRFECEMLRDYRTISLTVFDPRTEADIAIEVVQNGPAVLEAIDRLVDNALRFVVADV